MAFDANEFFALVRSVSLLLALVWHVAWELIKMKLVEYTHRKMGRVRPSVPLSCQAS